MKADKLFELIKRMTKQEKIFFQRFAQLSTNNKDKRYLQLFRAIEKQTKRQQKIDSTSLKKDFKYLSADKGYLMQNLLKALAFFYEEERPKEQVKAWIRQIHVLKDKELIPAAQQLIRKAAQIAKEYNLWMDLVALKNIEISLIEPDAVGLVRLEILIQKKQAILRQEANYDEYIVLHYQIMHWQAQYYFVDTEEKEQKFEALENSELLGSIDKAISTFAINQFYFSKNMVLFLKRDFEAWNKKYQEYMAFREGKMHLFGGYNEVVLYSNYLLSCIKVRDKVEFWKSIQKLETFQNLPALEAYTFFVLAVRKLEFYSSIGAFEKNRQWIEVVEEQLKGYQNRLDIKQKEFLYALLGRAYIELEDYKTALKWLSKLYKAAGFAPITALYLSVRLQIMICYYELNWWSNLESELRAVYRVLRQQKLQFDFYLVLMRFFQQVVKAVDVTAYKNALLDLKKAWEKLLPNPKENGPFEFFHYIPWLESKLQNQKLSECIKLK